MDPDAYQYRPPIDLTNARLRMLAAALGPAYVRVSGTWANTTYFTETDPPPARPPAGFNGVLTAQQWHGVVDFSKAVNAEIVSSFAISPGTRDPNGLWTPTVAWRWLDYTRSIGGDIAAAEFMNEPSLAAMGGAPAGYDAAAYGRDFKVFKAFADQAAPGMVILGPGSVGEMPGPWRMTYGTASVIRTSDMLAAAGPGVTVFSYHHYGAASQRCAAIGMPQITAKDALSEDWLRRTSQTRAYYGGLRDHYEPGKPLWVTEVADAACGGNPWAATFLDSFRYLDQLGRLARGCAGGDAQHPRRQRLRTAERDRLHPKAQLLGRPALASAHGLDSARSRSADPARVAPIRALPGGHARRRVASGHQQRPRRYPHADAAHARAAIHPRRRRAQSDHGAPQWPATGPGCR